MKVFTGRLSRKILYFPLVIAMTLASFGGITAATNATASAAVGGFYTTASPYLNARSGPGTGYSIVGTLNYGTPITVDCQAQGGTNVGGNATWDRLTNGWWIADYWTTTPSFNNYIPGVGPCTPNPTVAELAARWSEARIGQVYTSENRNATWWSGWCETFVEGAYGNRFLYGSAMDNYNSLASRGLIKQGAPPRGALVFWRSGTYGHVGIGVGSGNVVSTMGFSNQRLPVSRNLYTYFGNYLGWALPYGA